MVRHQAGAGESVTLEQALASAYAYLNRRERTRHEIRHHLEIRGAPDGIVEAALQELSGQGYLDDMRFSRLFVQDKRSLNGWGSERIVQALLARGISRDTVDAALLDADDADATPPTAHNGELQRALEVLERRFPAGLPDRRESDRALGVLVRKGYEYELAVEALTSHRRRCR